MSPTMLGRPEDPLASELEGRLFDARTIVLSGAVDQASVARMTAQLTALAAASGEAVKVILSAREGEHTAALALYDALRFIEPRVRVLGSGRVGAAATLVFVAVPREDRYCLPSTHFLLSPPSEAVGEVAQDVTTAAEQTAHLRTRMYEILAHQTGQPRERIEADLRRGDLWLTAEEAKAYGLVERIVEHAGELP